jgi:hypothetical protein
LCKTVAVPVAVSYLLKKKRGVSKSALKKGGGMILTVLKGEGIVLGF